MVSLSDEPRKLTKKESIEAIKNIKYSNIEIIGEDSEFVEFKFDFQLGILPWRYTLKWPMALKYILMYVVENQNNTN